MLPGFGLLYHHFYNNDDQNRIRELPSLSIQTQIITRRFLLHFVFQWLESSLFSHLICLSIPSFELKDRQKVGQSPASLLLHLLMLFTCLPEITVSITSGKVWLVSKISDHVFVTTNSLPEATNNRLCVWLKDYCAFISSFHLRNRHSVYDKGWLTPRVTDWNQQVKEYTFAVCQKRTVRKRAKIKWICWFFYLIVSRIEFQVATF